ncbi:glycosyltransferase family 4 protein [Clostridium sp.]|uniref:glycosyltransferase family 4 protein n=1 Tax=Clostridium sp. TaxID=1506 RepID=UPI0032164CC9
MKVLQINSVCGTGSTGRIASDIYKILEEQGHECVIAYGRAKAPEEIKSIKIGSILGNYTHVFKTRIFDKHGFGSVKATKEFIKQAKEYNPDVIHLHNIHGYYINIEILFDYLREANKPIVWTLHDCWAFTGHCSYFDYVGCDKWRNGCGNCEQKKEYPSSKVVDNSKWNYEKKKELFTSVKNMTIVTPSKWLAKLVRESFLGKYPVEVINNGIDLEVFKPTESDFRERHEIEDKFVVLGVASDWDRRKGLKYLIDLSEKLDSTYQVVVVGVSEKQKSELPDSIISFCRTNNVKELVEIYSAADVFVNPTLEDNFPTTNLEALACGTPVITFDTGGSIECINKESGVIIEKGNNQELLNIIKKLNCDRFEKREILKKSRGFEKRSNFRRYIEIYD